MITTVYCNADEDKRTDNEIYVTCESQPALEEEMKQKHKFCVYFDLEGLLGENFRGYAYCDTYNEAKKLFKEYLNNVLNDDDSNDEEDAFFPRNKKERDEVFDAYCTVGVWESGFSWKVRMMRSDIKYLNKEKRKEWLVGEGFVSEKEYKEARKIVLENEEDTYMGTYV